MKKRIALVGNMNNNFFAITRYLRDLGYDAHLFYRSGMEHFQPKADTYSLDYTDYCHEVDWLNNGFHNVDENRVIDALSGFDFYIGQADEAAVAFSCGFFMDVYYPYGTDISKYSYLSQEYSLRDKLLSFLRKPGKHRITYRQMQKGTLSKYQRGVIVNARYILAEYTNDTLVEKLNGLKYKGKFHKVPMPFIYLKDYESLNNGAMPDVHWRSSIDELRKKNEFIVLYHGRQEWKSFYHAFNNKNTHHLIIGFAEFLKKMPDCKACLAMLEYGNDVAHSKELIVELGIGHAVKWFPKMYRKDLMYLVKNVDVCTGEFDKSYLTFGTVIESMLMKKPVIHYREDDLYSNIYPELYPMLNAREPQEITDVLLWAVNNQQSMREIGEGGYRWMKKYFIEEPVTFLQKIIEQK